ncbi:MAG: nucleotide exchange factor GrpE, partial [Clostridiales bacterium]|nr:nucleotide exchange factor GrpE [Clostridiales bacterium]
MDEKTRERTRELPGIEVSQEEYKAMQNQIANATQQLSIAQAIAVKEKAKSEELSNLVNRMQADFDNYRKRMNESNKKLKEDGMCAVLEKIIPELDVLKQVIQT